MGEKKVTLRDRKNAENGLQRTVRQSNRSGTVKNAEQINGMGMQAIYECMS